MLAAISDSTVHAVCTAGWVLLQHSTGSYPGWAGLVPQLIITSNYLTFRHYHFVFKIKDMKATRYVPVLFTRISV